MKTFCWRWCWVSVAMLIAACGGEDAGESTTDTGQTTVSDAGQQDLAVGDTAVDDTGVSADSGPDTADTASACGDAATCSGPDGCEMTETCEAGCCVPVPLTCESLPPEGACRGDNAVYCDDSDNMYNVDCTSELGLPGDVVTTCGYISVGWGYYCVVESGNTCLFEVEGNPQPMHCGGEDPGCAITETGSACQTGLTACTSDDEGVCRGDFLVTTCHDTQPHGIDCTSFAGVCTSGQCVVPEGHACDDELVICEGTLTCNGVCQT